MWYDMSVCSLCNHYFLLFCTRLLCPCGLFEGCLKWSWLFEGCEELKAMVDGPLLLFNNDFSVHRSCHSCKNRQETESVRRRDGDPGRPTKVCTLFLQHSHMRMQCLYYEQIQVESRWSPTLLYLLFQQAAHRLVAHLFIQKVAGECSNCKRLKAVIKLILYQVWFHTDSEPAEFLQTALTTFWIFLEIFFGGVYEGIRIFFFRGVSWREPLSSIMERLVMELLQVTINPCKTWF